MAIADRHLWYTKDRAQVVEAGDLRAAFLFAPTGTQVSDADMERLGLSVVDGKIAVVLPEAAAVGPTPAAGGTSEPDPSDVAPSPPVAQKPKRGKPKKSLNV